MVDPKKEYETLMRCLQGDASESVSAPAPQQPLARRWSPAAKKVRVAPAGAAVPFKPGITLPLTGLFKKLSIRHRVLRRPRSFKRLRLVVAAVSLAVLTLVLWSSYSYYQLTPDSIYQKLFTPYIATAPGSNNAVAPYSIEHYYRTGNMVGATLAARKQAPVNARESLLLGIAYLQRADYTRSIKWLEAVAQNFKSPYRQTAEFYLALAYLKNDDFDHSIERMQQIAFNPAHAYHNLVPQSVVSDIRVVKWK